MTPTFMLFMDYEGAYDKINKQKLIGIIRVHVKNKVSNFTAIIVTINGGTTKSMKRFD